MNARRCVGWTVALLGCGLLLTAGTPARAGSSEKDPKVSELWGEYGGLRKSRDLVENRRRARIATALGAVSSQKALEHVWEIFTKDKEIEARLAAMRVLLAKGDVKLVSRVVRKAKGDKQCLARWLGTLLPTASDEAVGPWILEKSRLLSSSKTRLQAVEALGTLRLEAANDELLKLYGRTRKSCKEAPLVYETLRAIGRIGSDDTRGVILDAALSGHAYERRAAAEFLPALPDEDGACAFLVRELFGDEDGRVRETIVRAVGDARADAYVPLLIERLEDPWLRVRPAARQALAAVFGVDMGSEPSAWKTWWQRKQAGQTTSGDSMTVVEAKDERLHTNAVVFLLDISKSNSWQAPSMKNRIDVSKEKVITLIKRIEEPTVFNVIAVCGRPFPWQPVKRRGGPLVLATEENKKKAIQWIRERECAVHTNTWDAIQMVMNDHENVDTIHYVTDGAFRLGGYVYWEEMPMRIKEVNRLADVRIHVQYHTWGGLRVGFEKYHDVEEQCAWLQDVATRSGGTFALQQAP